MDNSLANLSLTNPPPTHYRPKPTSLPITLHRSLANPPTELLLQLFSDRIFLSISQRNGKLGTLLVCHVEESVIDNSTTYNIQTLLGSGCSSCNMEEESIREVYVRAIAEKIVRYTRINAGMGENTVSGEEGGACVPPLVVGLALTSFGREEFGRIVEVAMELYVEGLGLGENGTGMECPD
jgi:hypothetical protein